MNTYIPTLAGEPEATASRAALSTTGQYLIFHLGREEYGIHVPRIREIISLVPLELAPGLPYCVLGVVSILGKSIPVVDLRLRLGLAEPAPVNRPLTKDPDSTWTAGEYLEGQDLSDSSLYPGQGCIVMVDTPERSSGDGHDDRRKRGGTVFTDDPSPEFNFTGIVVDCISEIVSIRPEDIEPTSDPAAPSGLSCILGLVRVGRRTKTLLDIDLALNLDSWPGYALSRSLGRP